MNVKVQQKVIFLGTYFVWLFTFIGDIWSEKTKIDSTSGFHSKPTMVLEKKERILLTKILFLFLSFSSTSNWVSISKWTKSILKVLDSLVFLSSSFLHLIVLSFKKEGSNFSTSEITILKISPKSFLKVSFQTLNKIIFLNILNNIHSRKLFTHL